MSIGTQIKRSAVAASIALIIISPAAFASTASAITGDTMPTDPIPVDPPLGLLRIFEGDSANQQIIRSKPVGHIAIFKWSAAHKKYDDLYGIYEVSGWGNKCQCERPGESSIALLPGTYKIAPTRAPRGYTTMSRPKLVTIKGHKTSTDNIQNGKRKRSPR
jgi:hypothetical protein